MTDAELKDALEAVALAAMPTASNNRYALLERVKDVLSIFASLSPAQYAQMHSALYPPADDVVAALSDRMERFARRLTADGSYVDASIVEAALHYVKKASEIASAPMSETAAASDMAHYDTDAAWPYPITRVERFKVGTDGVEPGKSYRLSTDGKPVEA